MFRKRYYYIIELQYLGFRYHGWQKQPKVNTVQRMMERTIAYVLGHTDFKVLASGRTDAKVSVNCTFVELFVDNIELQPDFFDEFNANLPQDIRALSMKETDANFNIILHPKMKEYIYFFTFGEKFHPFCAPFMLHYTNELDIVKMQEAAQLFIGDHDFRSYCHRPKKDTVTRGYIDTCEVVKNDIYTANFFPEESYMLRVKGLGFKRNQIRLMMGALLDVGSGKITIEFIEKTLNPTLDRIQLEHIAPGSGLMLNSVKFLEPTEK